MKKFSFLLFALLMGAVIGVNSCSSSNDDPELKGEEVPEVEAIAGKVVLVLNCVDNAQVCNGLVFAGNYNGWDLDPTQIATFEAIPDYEGWYKVAITPNADEASETSILEGKPNQLAKDGSFPSSWDHQWMPIFKADGTTVDKECEVIKGAASLKGEYSGEQSLIVQPGADVVYLRAHAWKKNPCVDAPKYNITFNVTIPALHDSCTIYIVGDINGWTADGNPMTKVDATHWTIEVADVEFGAEYKYVVNGSWDYEELQATEDGCGKGITNRKVNDRTINDVVANFRSITVDKCPDE